MVFCEVCEIEATLISHFLLVYNPNAQIQASSRALRATQTKKIFIYLLFWDEEAGKGALEGQIIDLQILKWYFRIGFDFLKAYFF